MSTGQRAYMPKGQPMKSRSIRLPVEQWNWIAKKAQEFGHSETRVISTYLSVLQQADQETT